jgi:hypothetical protein
MPKFPPAAFRKARMEFLPNVAGYWQLTQLCRLLSRVLRSRLRSSHGIGY